MEPRDLYGLPLDRFVPERTALAKALRAEGRREEAAVVAKLRRPSVAAWAVNQLVRTQTSAIRALADAGDRLQAIQAELLAGRGDARAMREAGERERAAVAELTGAARGLLSSEGHELSPATLDRVAETLHAAAFDEHARAQVLEACLEKELRHVGLGGLAPAELPAPAAAPAKPKPKPKTTPERKPRAADRERERERERVARGAAERAAEQARREAEGEAEAAALELEQAEARHSRASAELRNAEAALEAARRRAAQARRALEAL